MDFALTEEQHRAPEWAHEFAEKEIRPVAAEYDESEEFPWPVVKKAAEAGLYGIDIYMQAPAGPDRPDPAAPHGGDLLGLRRHRPRASSAPGSRSPRSASVGTQEQLFEWAPKMFGTPEDPKVAAFGVTEPQAGSDVRIAPDQSRP